VLCAGNHTGESTRHAAEKEAGKRDATIRGLRGDRIILGWGRPVGRVPAY
jgi:hypothetical protein